MKTISSMVIEDDGCTFTPTDEELVGYYLYNKIVGNQDTMTLNVELPVVDPYSQQPCVIWQQFGGIDDQDLYFFTKLNKKKSRVTRKVAVGGTWSGESKAHAVFSSSLGHYGASDPITIGSFKRFHYENNNLDYKGSGGDDYSWIMYEYTLDPTCVPIGIVHDSFVLCKIHRRQISKKKNTNITYYDHSAGVPTTLFASDNGRTTTTQMEQGGEEKEQYIDNSNLKRRKLAQQEEKEKDKEEQGMADNLSCIHNMAFTEEQMNELLYSNGSDYQHPQIPTTQMEFWNQIPPHLEQPPNQCSPSPDIVHHDYSAAVPTTLFASDNGPTTTTRIEQEHIDNQTPKRRKLAQEPEEKDEGKVELEFDNNFSCINNMGLTQAQFNELSHFDGLRDQFPQISSLQMEFWNQMPPHLEQPPNQCPTTLQMESNDQNADDIFAEALERDLEQYSTLWSDFQI